MITAAILLLAEAGYKDGLRITMHCVGGEDVAVRSGDVGQIGAHRLHVQRMRQARELTSPRPHEVRILLHRTRVFKVVRRPSRPLKQTWSFGRH